MADAAVTFLLENVVQLVTYQVNLIGGAEDELNRLKKDLGTLNSFLRDAAKMANKPEGFRDIERRIRDVVYEAEDTIDSCISNNAAAASTKNPVRKLLKSKRVSLAEEVKSLREGEVCEMVKTVQTFIANSMANNSQQRHLDLPSNPFKPQTIREANVVGFEEAEKKILGYLREPKEKLDVMSIVGMPGLGKTTLAWKVFKNQDVISEFPNRIWVYVTQTPNIKNVFLEILKEFTSEDMSGLRFDKLKETVQYYLNDRKFLLVLDDVWTTEAWNAINVVLQNSYSMSKVIVTSRHEGVGNKASLPRKSYNLPLLLPAQSWELLQYEVFGQLKKCHANLNVVGQCIATNCGGLPLSIVVIGGILLDKCSKNVDISVIKDEWLKVSGHVTDFLKNDVKQQVSNIVELSYNSLPDKLKDCLLYLRVFPEDYEISVWKLVRMWIAEGFIQGEGLEETAEEYLKDLISMNLVMAVKRNIKGEVKTCRIHDVVYAFCGSKLLQEQQRFFYEMKCVNNDFVPPSSEIGKPRRLCFHSELDSFLSDKEKMNFDRIRSLLFFYKAPANFPDKYTPTMVKGFNMLRVLESEFNRMNQIPKGVTELYHLRYLTICVDTLKTLAEDFSNLWNLQTLVIYTKMESITIKANILKMIQLRHLKTNVGIIGVGKGDGVRCTSLQTLSRISPEICTTNFFNKFPNLKRLGIQGKLANLFQTNSLGMLNQLEKLKLVNTHHDSESRGSMRFPELASWFPLKLKMLTIEGTSLDWNHMSKLGMIETLQVLKLKDNAFTGMAWEVVGGGFHSLHFLLIEDTELLVWEASKNSFPRLRFLVLRQCRKLQGIPDAVVGILEKLDIEHLSATAVDSAKKIAAKKEANQEKEGASRFKLTIGVGCESD
ncbi:putative late blight resistance protein homolog R1A-10 [Salvia splendens]|uniref:putative late blight resistance protein homolog R1A-10 n=1 Tax=Salvia splendens TaxID=180675 RepID=UPI001C276357|nr:putative late blight resistance protein homolog R1A-10 [Salvia splendens]